MRHQSRRPVHAASTSCVGDPDAEVVFSITHVHKDHRGFLGSLAEREVVNVEAMSLAQGIPFESPHRRQRTATDGSRYAAGSINAARQSSHSHHAALPGSKSVGSRGNQWRHRPHCRPASGCSTEGLMLSPRLVGEAKSLWRTIAVTVLANVTSLPGVRTSVPASGGPAGPRGARSSYVGIGLDRAIRRSRNLAAHSLW
jgi:hypothetical protein